MSYHDYRNAVAARDFPHDEAAAIELLRQRFAQMEDMLDAIARVAMANFDADTGGQLSSVLIATGALIATADPVFDFLEAELASRADDKVRRQRAGMVELPKRILRLLPDMEAGVSRSGVALQHAIEFAHRDDWAESDIDDLRLKLRSLQAVLNVAIEAHDQAAQLLRDTPTQSRPG